LAQHNGTEETEMNTGSKSVTVKYIANYWRVCWCNKLVRTYDTREEAESCRRELAAIQGCWLG
jgi:hypothetical protein